MTEVKVPKTAEEAEAMDLAIAKYQLAKITEVKEFLESDETKAFEAKLNALVEGRLPPGTSAGNLNQLPKFFTDVRRQAAQDFMNLDMKINPPKMPEAPTETPGPSGNTTPSGSVSPTGGE